MEAGALSKLQYIIHVNKIEILTYSSLIDANTFNRLNYFRIMS